MFHHVEQRMVKRQNGSQKHPFHVSFSPIYNRGNKCWQKSQFTVFVTPLPPFLNVVIDLVAKKSMHFNTNATFL